MFIPNLSNLFGMADHHVKFSEATKPPDSLFQYLKIKQIGWKAMDLPDARH